MINSVGALMLAAMVCPASIERSITRPEIGERISAYFKLVLARFRATSADFTAAALVWTSVFFAKYVTSEIYPS